MTFQQVLTKPLVLAGKELAFVFGSFYASTKVVKYTYAQLLSANFIVKADLDEGLKISVGAGAEAIKGILSIAFYGGLSRLTHPGQTSFQWFPSFPHRPQIPIPRAIVAGCLTLVLSPLAYAFIGVVSLPAIELFRSGFKIKPKAEEQKTRIGNDDEGRSLPVTQVPANNDGTSASAEPEPTTETPVQISNGTQIGPTLEAAVPGIFTIMIPLCEEILFRGMLFGRLVPSIGFLPAALGSSALFGCIHQGSNGSTYFPVAETILGFACSLLYFRTGRLLVPIALHSGFNSCGMLLSAMQSAPLTIGYRWLVTKDEDKVPASTSGLSFWERRVAENYSALDIVVSSLVSWLMNDANTSEGGPLFLSLDFWGAKESLQRVFIDRQNERLLKASALCDADGRLLKAPALCDADGSTTEFAEFLIGKFLTTLFENEDSISVDKLIDYNVRECFVRFAFHILFTTPEQVESLPQDYWALSPPQVINCLNDSLEGELSEKLCTKLAWTIGVTVLSHPSGKVTRSEVKELYNKWLHFGFYSEVNESLFINYLLANENLSILEAVREYLVLSSDLGRHNAEGAKETV